MVLNDGMIIHGANLSFNEYGPPLFATLFFVITGFHGAHVLSGVILNILVFYNTVTGVYQQRGHYEMVEKSGLYWHFIDLVWVFVFTFFYLINLDKSIMDCFTTHMEPQPVNKEKVKKLVRIALILGIITTVEFIMALTMPRGYLLYAIYIGLTIVKAYYIVSEFMHLKYETKALIWTILLPLVLIIWLIIALLDESGSIFQM